MRLLISNANQFKIKQDLLWVGIFTFITALTWIVYSIYLAYNQTTIDPEISAILEPLNPTLDQETLTLVGNRFEPPQNFVVIVEQEEVDELEESQIPSQNQQSNDSTSSATLQINSLNETQSTFPDSTSSATTFSDF